MERITLVLKSGMGMLLDSVRPYLKPGMPIAIGRAGAVIAEVAEGNAIEDKRLAAESAAGYIDSVERYVEGANTLESVVAGLENTLLNIERHAEAGQNGSALQAMDALRRIRELTAAFLDNSGARAERGSPASGAAAEPAYPGAAAARRPVNPGEHPHSAPVLTWCSICSKSDHFDEACPWRNARGGLALVQEIDKRQLERRTAEEALGIPAKEPVHVLDFCIGRKPTPWGDGHQTAQQQENEHWRNLNAARYEWLRSAALDTGSANVPMVRIGMGDPLQGVALDAALNEAMANWPIHGDDYYAHDAELQAADPLGLAARVSEFNRAHTGALKPGIFDVITGTAGATGDGSGAQLPPLDEHLAQVEQVAAGLREDQAELAESILVLEDWLERVEVEDGYVGVPVIEAVEVVVTELKRQQQPVDPAFCRCNHWFAGDSIEAAFIRQHGQCRDCVEMDQILEREVQAENAKRYLWLRNTALSASDLAREVNRLDKSIVNLIPRDKDGNLLADAELDEAIDAAMAKWPAEVLCAGVDVAADRVELAIHNWTAPAEGGDA